MEALLEFKPESDKVEPVPTFYYIQDSRYFDGNSAMWWRHGGAGYTTNLDEAMRVTGRTGDWMFRETDILWPVDEIDARATRQFDAQNFRDIRKKYVPLPKEDDSCLCNGRGCARCCGPA